jgi:hypothetical protein
MIGISSRLIINPKILKMFMKKKTEKPKKKKLKKKNLITYSS